MNLQDHFRPPLSSRRHWHGFHNAWATYIASSLNSNLPEGYFAEPNVQFGIEIDVAAFEDLEVVAGAEKVAAQVVHHWQPTAPSMTIPLPIVTDSVEVLIFNSAAGPTLAAAVELVSPANKDRPSHREAFVSKCETYLQQGIGLAIVDIVTERQANLHEELLARLMPASVATESDELLYATAYRPVERSGETSLDIWHQALVLGQPMQTIPLWLRGGICLPLELAATYERTCREQRIPVG